MRSVHVIMLALALGAGAATFAPAAIARPAIGEGHHGGAYGYYGARLPARLLAPLSDGLEAGLTGIPALSARRDTGYPGATWRVGIESGSACDVAASGRRAVFRTRS